MKATMRVTGGPGPGRRFLKRTSRGVIETNTLFFVTLMKTNISVLNDNLAANTRVYSEVFSFITRL